MKCVTFHATELFGQNAGFYRHMDDPSVSKPVRLSPDQNRPGGDLQVASNLVGTLTRTTNVLRCGQEARSSSLSTRSLRNYEIPKLYWRVANLSGPRYDVVDGQQRLRTVWEFCQGKFKLPKDADPVEGHKIAGLTYERLPHQLRIRFDTYALDIVEINEGSSQGLFVELL